MEMLFWLSQHNFPDKFEFYYHQFTDGVSVSRRKVTCLSILRIEGLKLNYLDRNSNTPLVSAEDFYRLTQDRRSYCNLLKSSEEKGETKKKLRPCSNLVSLYMVNI